MTTPTAALPLKNHSCNACFKRWIAAICGISAALIGLASSPVLMAQSAGSPLNLVWDLGATDAGSQVVTQPSTAAGNYYYRINTKSAEVWRTR